MSDTTNAEPATCSTMTATTTGSSTMSDFLTKLRSEHRKAHRSASDETWDQQPMCFVCQTPWPCDAAKAADEIERLRAALEGVRTSVGQALDRIDRAPVPRTAGVNPVAREYLDQALAITREVLGDE